MRASTHTTQVYSVFGSGYVPEDHGHGVALKESGNPLREKWTITLVAFLCVAVTAGAIAAVNQTRAPPPDLWKQATPTFILNLPGGYGVEQALF